MHVRTHHTHGHGRHEHGQNFLKDQRVARKITGLVAATHGPILEVGPGDGALTLPMQRLGRPQTAVEIDPAAAAALRARSGPGVDVVTADFLRTPLPRQPHVIVGNLPFHLTTAILRKLLHSRQWDDAVLITQWEVARRRAGVGGSTMMTAQWSPFYQFGMGGRIPAQAYTPAPSVDAGILTISRRASPLLPWKRRKTYASFVHRIFTGRGRGVAQILQQTIGVSRATAGRVCGQANLRKDALPKQISADQWAQLWYSLSARRD